MNMLEALTKKINKARIAKKNNWASANTWFAVCSSERHTAKEVFAVCYAQSRTAKHFPPINLERGKIWQLSAVRFAPHARQRNFPPVQINFPRNIGDGGKIWNPGQPICRVGA